MGRRYSRTAIANMRQKRVGIWTDIGTASDKQNLAAATSVLVASLSVSGLALRPFTIVRTRMLLSVQSDQVSAIEEPQGAFAGVVVTDSAVAAGIASIPTPLTESEASWWFWQAWQDMFTFSTGASAQGRQGYQYAIDSKSQRKVGLDDDIAVVLQQASAIGAIIGVEGRILVKLH